MTHSPSPKTIFIFIITLLPFNLFSLSSWELQKDKCGIKVWTQKVQNSSIDKYKVEGFIDAKPQKIVETLMNFSTFSKWHDSIKQAKTLKKISETKSMAYMELDFPWPTRNRDSYAYSEVVKDKVSGGTKVTINQLKKQFKTKNVRVAKSEGFWLVVPKGSGAVVS